MKARQKNINCIIPTTGTTEVGVLCDFQLMAVLLSGFTFGQLFLSFPVLWQRVCQDLHRYLLGTRKGKQIEEQIIHGSFVGSFRIADRHQHHLLPLVVFTPSPSFVGSFRIAHRHHHHPSHHHRHSTLLKPDRIEPQS